MRGSKTTRESVETSIYLEDGTYISHTESVYRDEPFNIDISKMSDDKHMVFGWANISINKDGDIPLDWQGDITSPAVLETAAYKYVLKHRGTGEMHEGEIVGHMVESCMFTKEKMQAMGIPEGVVPEGWWIGFYIPDDAVCEKIKKGEYNMFSIQGKAKRLKI